MNYEQKQIQRVLDAGPDPETGGVFHLKIEGHAVETKWLTVTGDQVEAIQTLLGKGCRHGDIAACPDPAGCLSV